MPSQAGLSRQKSGHWPEAVVHIDALVGKYRRKGILIDTNLLIGYLVGLLGKPHLVNCRATKGFGPADFDLLARFLSHFELLVTTPHVLTEVSNLGGRLPSALHVNFRILFRELVSKDAASEETLPSKSIIASANFLRFGIADTAISMIAPKRYLVLTDELALYGLLQKQGVDVINFNHLRQFFWQH